MDGSNRDYNKSQNINAVKFNNLYLRTRLYGIVNAYAFGRFVVVVAVFFLLERVNSYIHHTAI